MARVVAGPELNAFIGESLMGWKRAPATNPPNRHWPLRGSRTWRSPGSYHVRALPKFSEDHNAAALVVDALRARGWVLALSTQDGPHAIFWPHGSRVDGVGSRGDTIPAAICLAARAVVETSPVWRAQVVR